MFAVRDEGGSLRMNPICWRWFGDFFDQSLETSSSMTQAITEGVEFFCG